MKSELEQHTEPAGKDRLFTPVFIILIAASLCCFVTGQGLNAGTSVYISRLGGTATLAGVGALVFSVSALVGRIASGPLADTRGRRIVMLVGVVILFAGTFGTAVAGNVDLMMLWRALQGLGFSCVTTAAATAAADVLPAERLGEGIGYYGLAQAFAMTIGPALGIALVMVDPPETLYWGLTLVVAVAFVLTLFCGYEKHPERLPLTATYRERMKAAGPGGAGGEGASLRTATSDASAESDAQEGKGAVARLIAMFAAPGALAGGIPILFFAPAAGFEIYFIGLLGNDLQIGNGGFFFTVSAITMILVRVSSKAFMDRVPALKVYAVAIAAGLVCFAIMFCATLHLVEGVALQALFYGSGMFYGVCFGLALPVNQAVAVKNSPAEKWGAANGLFLLLFDLGMGVSSVIWGVTNDLFGFSFTIGCVVVLLAVSFAAACIVYPPFAKRG